MLTYKISRRPFIQRMVRTIYPLDSTQTVRRGSLKGYKIFVSPSMGATYIWSTQDWSWIALIKNGQCVYDIGANCGQSTLHIANAVGSSGRVIALEPVPENFRRLQRNIEFNGLN